MDYPLINGHRYSYASIEADVNGKKFYGHKEISYSQDLEPGEVRGAHSQVLGRTKGDLKAEGSLTTYLEEWKELLDALGDGYMEKSFDITVSYAEDGRPTVTDKLRGCRIKKVEESHSQGTDGLTMKIDLHILWIEFGGKKPLKKMLS